MAVDETWTVGTNTWPVEVTTSEIAPGVKYTFVNWKTNRSSTLAGSHLHVIEADLTNPKISVENVKPDAMTGNRTLTDHAKTVHKADHQVVAGANGNFWSTSPETGFYSCMGAQPHGLCVMNGVMYTDHTPSQWSHCGGPTMTGMMIVDEKGKCYIDYTNYQKANNDIGSGVQFAAINNRIGHRMNLTMCNRFVDAGQASIFTRQYGTNKTFRVGDLTGAVGTWTPTMGTTGYIEIILDYAEGVTAMNVGGTTDYVIKEMRFNPESVGTLGDHDLAIVGRSSYATVPHDNWKVGDIITIDTKVNFQTMGSPEKIVTGISGNVLAMKNGTIQPNTTAASQSYNTSLNSRTVYGTNAEGTKLWIMTCEHNVTDQTTKKKQYCGFSLEQLCIMGRDKFGIENMTQVDCGGSAQMYANGGQVAMSYDATGKRAVYNGIFVVYNDSDITIPTPGSNDNQDPEPEDPDKDWKDSGERAHFAYNLGVVEGQDIPTVAYSLTGKVKAVDVILTNRDNESDVVVLEGGTAAGENTVKINDPRLTTGATYDWTVKVYSNAVSGTSHFFHDAAGKLDSRGGVGVVTDPESNAYGKIIVSRGYAQGFALYNADGTKQGDYHAGMQPWATSNRSSNYRLAMRDNKVAYACDFSDAGAGYWKFDPENPEAEPINLAGGTNDGTGCFKMADSNDCVGSGATGIGFQGTGEDTRLWVFAEDWPSGNSTYKGILSRWDIGTADKVTKGVNAAYAQYAGNSKMANQNVCITGTPNGIFAAQHRGAGSNTVSCPGFIYTDINGDLLYNSGDHPELFNSCGGSVAITNDLSIAAVAGRSENIKIFRVTWEDNVPTFKYLADVNDTKYCTEVCQLAFDPAGNLYAWQRNTAEEHSGLFGYSWKNDNPEAITPAKADYCVVAPQFSAIDEIVSDGDEATPIYYTIQGVRVDASALAPGLYIKVTGRKSEKVIVK
ncbi:MAG: phosphodiester glycosidase family protein [Muribaculum sp.]|nr:phosphodiester glycosidase family protein [Muribaculum sp.]